MKRLDKQEKYQKTLRGLEGELSRLYKAREEKGMVSLEKPLKCGWIKHLALRNDIARRADAKVFQEVIDQCGIKVWGADKQHANREWERYNQANPNIDFPGMGYLFGEKMVDISPKARLWFNGYDWQWIHQGKMVKRYFCRIPRHFLVTTYSRAFLYNIRVVNPDLESRIDFLNSRVFSNELYSLACRREKEGKWGCRRWSKSFVHKRARKRGRALLRDYEEASFEKRIHKHVNPY